MGDYKVPSKNSAPRSCSSNAVVVCNDTGCFCMSCVTFKTSCKAVSLRQHSESGSGDRAQSSGFSMSPCRVIPDNEALCTHSLCREVSAVISTKL
jgi:hypothetical protein